MAMAMSLSLSLSLSLKMANDWMNLWRKEEDNEKSIRSLLGRLLFSKHDIEKSVKVISGGEKSRMIFGKLSSGYYYSAIPGLSESVNRLVDLEYGQTNINYALS
jgi:hypothetical protein